MIIGADTRRPKSESYEELLQRIAPLCNRALMRYITSPRVHWTHVMLRRPTGNAAPSSPWPSSEFVRYRIYHLPTSPGGDI